MVRHDGEGRGVDEKRADDGEDRGVSKDLFWGERVDFEWEKGWGRGVLRLRIGDKG